MHARPMLERLRLRVDRIRYRLLVVNVFALLVPVVGLELANIFERELLDSLERDMRNQAVLSARLLEQDLADGIPLAAPRHAAWLMGAARDTRMRIRVVGPEQGVVVDSHRYGPPEGPEPPPPSIVPRTVRRGAQRVRDYGSRASWSGGPQTWPEVRLRREVVRALSGKRAAITRLRRRPSRVFLFVAEPVTFGGDVAAAVYVVRSTRPVMVELYRIRARLIVLLCGAVILTMLLTLVLAWSISRPLARLADASGRIAAGERDVRVPIGGSAEIRALGESFATMTERLDDRMRYIRDFAADVAHEFKSPLTSIRGAAELLAEGAADDPEARQRFLRNIELDSERLDQLVTRLLELSRIEASEQAPARFDLERLLARLVERVQEPDVRVNLDYAAAVRFVIGREPDLETAFANLLDNAVRHAPSGSEVDVHVANVDGELRVRVADRGPGVPEELRERVFERFYTSGEREQGGTGLGLSIVRAAALAHDGRAWVQPREGGGSEFVFALPSAGGS